MLGDMKPFRMAGNLYFVGTYKASSHLIDTGDGLILIDTGYEETADVIIESVTELGFDVRDIRIILHSHGHCDHTDGTPKMVAVSGAKTYMDKADIKYIKGWKPDYTINDGDVITLGNTQVLCLSTPGHTEGSVCIQIENAIFTGDTLFFESYGRTDFPSGNAIKLIESAKKLFGLTGNYVLYTWHGESTTLDYERKHNAINFSF